MTDYYQRNRDKILAYQKQYREKHKKLAKTDVIETESSNTDELTKSPKVFKYSKLQNKKLRLNRLLMRNKKRVIAFLNNVETTKATDKVIEFIHLDTPINPFLSV